MVAIKLYGRFWCPILSEILQCSSESYDITKNLHDVPNTFPEQTQHKKRPNRKIISKQQGKKIHPVTVISEHTSLPTIAEQ